MVKFASVVAGLWPSFLVFVAGWFLSSVWAAQLGPAAPAEAYEPRVFAVLSVVGLMVVATVALTARMYVGRSAVGVAIVTVVSVTLSVGCAVLTFLALSAATGHLWTEDLAGFPGYAALAAFVLLCALEAAGVIVALAYSWRWLVAPQPAQRA